MESEALLPLFQSSPASPWQLRLLVGCDPPPCHSLTPAASGSPVECLRERAEGEGRGGEGRGGEGRGGEGERVHGCKYYLI